MDAFTRRRLAREIDAESLNPEKPVHEGAGVDVFDRLDALGVDYTSASTVAQLHDLVEDRLRRALENVGGWPGATTFNRTVEQHGWAPLSLKLGVIGFDSGAAARRPRYE